ncbi:MAG: VanZ family protein [Betaproteobacteria bacterium]|nr:VanZ family protein [Betaproteobacteria bacterium]
MRLNAGPSPLARYLVAAYSLLVVYASLHPFSGWVDNGAAPLAWLAMGPPPYITAFDVSVNVLAYLPLGFLGVLALYPVARGASAMVLTFLLSTALSACLESLQTYLPSRYASNIDFGANAAGALMGTLIGVAAARMLLREDGLQALRYRLFRSGARIDLGLVLLGLWLFSLLSPETLLFGNGDLRSLFQTPSGRLYPAELFMRVEAAVAGANALAVCLFAGTLMRAGQPSRVIMVAVLTAGLLVRTVAYGLLFSSQEMLLWVTPGALFGTAVGAVLAILAAGLPRPARLGLAALSLMFAAAVVNFAPENPYLAAFLAEWRQGHFLNFNGLTRIVSAAWPFAALVHLMALASDRNQRRDGGDWGGGA